MDNLKQAIYDEFTRFRILIYTLIVIVSIMCFWEEYGRAAYMAVVLRLYVIICLTFVYYLNQYRHVKTMSQLELKQLFAWLHLTNFILILLSIYYYSFVFDLNPIAVNAALLFVYLPIANEYKIHTRSLSIG